MKNNLSYIIKIMFTPLLFVFIIWIIIGVEYIFDISFVQYGIRPLSFENIFGIITFPFIHSDINHLFNNTYPLLILGGIISQVYHSVSNKVFLYSYLLSGSVLWIIGNPSINVVGASGVVYSLGSFILVSGFIKKQPRLAMLSFLVIFLNFFNLWGIIEIEQDRISQTAHLSGAIAGAILAVFFRRKGPQPKIYNYEIEEELEEKNKINYLYKENS
ncbi:MAG: rhomboid family intramembrane serine protease [Flavobacteriales bacterium]|nr:rhomboid family intramembrane serine protease [Flavobacteriales bacterium]|tara:strand:- start:3337 stop:3984 length:648 start_codon:yes stop_codon:yes gene_type:complete